MPGYSHFGKMMGKRPDLGIFRTFSGLRAQTLLYMQAELLYLESEMESFVQVTGMASYDQSFAALAQSLDSNSAFIWREKVQEIHEKLERYYGTLLQAASVNSLPAPNKSDLGFLRRFIDHQTDGASFLNSMEASPWKDDTANDLVLLGAGNQPGDRLAEYISDKIVPIYYRAIGCRLHNRTEDADLDFAEIWEYKKEALSLTGNLLCVLLSAFVPTLSIFVLYFVKSIVARLSAIIMFSLLFSLLMTFVIDGRRADVWAATTAFAAVQVVFIGVGPS